MARRGLKSLIPAISHDTLRDGRKGDPQHECCGKEKRIRRHNYATTIEEEHDDRTAWEGVEARYAKSHIKSHIKSSTLDSAYATLLLLVVSRFSSTTRCTNFSHLISEAGKFT